MTTWGGFYFQDSMTLVMELLSYFHDYMMIILIFIMVFVTWIFYFILNSKRVDKYTLDSHLLETVWTIIPMIILLFMAFPSLYLLYLMEDISNSLVTTKVIGHQWYWEYQMNNSLFSESFDSYMMSDSADKVMFYSLDVDNRLSLPTHSSLLFLVTSSDVIHSFTVPSLGIKTDAIPGRLNYLNALVNMEGIYFGQCSEICGSNHSFMPISLECIKSVDYINFILNKN